MAEDVTSRTQRNAPDQPWSQVWHLPVLLLGLGLLALGVYLAMPEPENNDYGGVLDEVGVLLLAENPDAAQARLEAMRPFIEEASATEQARYWQYWGDLNYLKLHRDAPTAAQGEAGRVANQQIVSCYANSAALGRPLDSGAVRRHAQTLVSLGRGAEALQLLEELKDEPARQRYQIVRQLIERQHEMDPLGSITKLAPLIERFNAEIRLERDAAARREQEIWVNALQARLQIEAGDPERAIGELLKRLARLTTGPNQSDLAPLRVLLAKAYQQTGEMAEAQRIYQSLQQQLEAVNELLADVHVGLGQIALVSQARDESNLHEALEHFATATREYPSVLPASIDALIGQADCEARLQNYPDAVQHFQLAVEKILASAPRWDSRRDLLSQVVHSHIQRSADDHRFDLALDLLTLVAPLYEPELPEEMILEFALTHEKIAEERQAYANPPAGEDGPAPAARRLANQEASTHFTRAAEYYLRHARAVTISDTESHGRSLWSAANCYDRAERWKDAIAVYSEYISTRETDPLKLRAVHQLAHAYLADGQHQAAADLFLQLLADHPNSLEAYDSLVPLARAYLAMDQTDHAERTLLQVVSDHESITPDSEQYQKALVELGKLYYRLGESDGKYYVQAIERLNESVERYGDTPAGASLRFLLADAYRLSVGALDEELAQRQAQGDRLALQAERSSRLEKAQNFFDEVVKLLDARDKDTLTPLETLYHRNAWFYRADCAFDRRQYDAAIDLYDQAARRWKGEPSSLVALVQMVNAYCELGQYQDARVINERARGQLARMPDEAFDDPTLPMSREHWEDWLRWTSEVELFGEQALADTPGTPLR